ncbi:hypothetical protein R3P38DRAFT_3189774 [Favolaschia claudopus]|uniref:Uncharacterized protein n=1 Tax=Favolaschia claudopus TaxID=2862362 RepID=A0AAW0BNL3_9AGAR
MSTPPPPSGRARSLRALPFSCLLFLDIRSESTSIYLGGPPGAMSSHFHLLAPHTGIFPLLIAVLEGSQAAYRLQALLVVVYLIFAVRDWNLLVNVSATRAAIYLAECTSQATPAFYPSCRFYIYFGIQAREASLSMGILLRMRRSLLGHWGSAEEFPIASESPWGWALSRFPSTIQTESASVIHKLTFSP